MKNLKKVLALALSATMALSMFVTGAGAAFTDVADIKAVDAVNMLTTLGVIEGNPDGSFKPDATVSRAEMAKMIFVVRNNKVDDSAYANISTKFTDINGHWAAGYIKFCESQGIIAGKTATSFDPDAEVTGTEAAKMLLVLTGYASDKAGLTGPQWATNTLRYAAEAGILDEVDSPLESGLPRQYAAQQIANTLDAWRVKWSNDSGTFDYFVSVGGSAAAKETVGRKYMGLHSSVSTLVSVDKDSIEIGKLIEAESNGKEFSFSKVKTDYTNLLGQKVKVMYKDGKNNDVIGVYALSDNDAKTVNAKDVEQDGTQIKFGGKSYTIENHEGGTDDNTTLRDQIKVRGVDYKGDKLPDVGSDEVASSHALFSDTKQSSDVYTFVDTDGNGRMDNVIITGYKAAKVTYASSAQIVAGATYKYADHNIAEGIAKDDWVIISYNRFDDCQEIVKADKITGKLSATKTDTDATKTVFNQYKIDDTWYNASDFNRAELNTVKAGNTVEGVAVNGILYYVKRTTGTTGTITDVALVVNKSDDLDGKRAYLQFFDGTTETVTVNNDNGLKYNGINVGGVYEFTKSDNKYTFENVNNTVDYYGDFTAVSSNVITAGSNASVGGKKIADTAKVILFQDNGKDIKNDVKVITGKQFKNSVVLADIDDAISGTGLDAIAAFTADMSGVNQVGAVAVLVNTMPDTLVTKDNYAYIVDGAVKSGNNTIQYDIWTGSEKITVQESNSKIADRKKGHVVGYKSLSDITDSEMKKINDVTQQNMVPVAIDGFNSSEVTFGRRAPGISASLDRTTNTKIFNVVSDPASGQEIGINASDVMKAGKDEYGVYYYNALALDDGANDLEILVVDITGKMTSPYVTDASASKLVAGTVTNNMVYNVLNDPAKTAKFNVALNNMVEKVGTDTVAYKMTVTGDSRFDITVGTTAGATGESVAYNGSKAIDVKPNATLPVGTYNITVKLTNDQELDELELVVPVEVKSATATTLDTFVVSGDLATDVPTAGDKLNELITKVTAHANDTAKVEVTGFNATVTGATGSYELAAEDKVVVTIDLKAKAGYTLTDETAVPALQGVAGTIDVTGDTATVTYEFTTAAAPKTPITTLAITNTVAAPAAKDAQTFAKAAAPTLTGLVNATASAAPTTWTGTTYAANDKLTAVYTLTPADGYEFDTTSLTTVTASSLTNVTATLTNVTTTSATLTLTATIQADTPSSP